MNKKWHNAKMRENKIFVAMSGGVDSSVAALLLKNQGYDVTGCFIKGWYPPDISCSWKEDRRDAMRVCISLGIPFITINLDKEYKREVVDYMIREYKAGRTPNPDVMCNKHIKFGAFLKVARKLGADYIATGHYVRTRQVLNDRNVLNGRVVLGESNQLEQAKRLNKRSDRATRTFSLSQAKDLNKDQSYFLWTLTQGQLKYCFFPLSNLTKPEVRAIAKKNGLITAEKADSQGVCFIGKFSMIDFLKKYTRVKKGLAITKDGEVVGEHDGVYFYTIGQRHGFSKGGGASYYVVAKDIKKNLLIVADKADEKKFYKKEVHITGANWINSPPVEGKLYRARIRYRQPLQSCKVFAFKKKLYLLKDGRRGKSSRGKVFSSSCFVVFSKSQRAITPGQSLVLYNGKRMLGGGVIVK